MSTVEYKLWKLTNKSHPPHVSIYPFSKT